MATRKKKIVPMFDEKEVWEGVRTHAAACFMFYEILDQDGYELKTFTIRDRTQSGKMLRVTVEQVPENNLELGL